MIEVNGLTKVYGKNTAVDHLNFKIGNGKIYGLLGQNGAGKSTTMNMMTGCLLPTEGTVRINGFDISEEPDRAKRCIGYLPEIPPLYQDMTPQEFLIFVAEAKGIPHEQIGTAVRDVLAEVHITAVKDRLIRYLSKGFRQRVGIAQAILGDPDIIILDEPTVGLDPKQIIEIRSLIRSLGKRHTVILSSHILSEIEEVCDHVLVLSHGKLVANDTLEALRSRAGRKGGTLTVTVRGDEKGILSVLNALSFVKFSRVTARKSGTVTVQLDVDSAGDLRDEVIFALAAKRYAVLSSESGEQSLEGIFLALTDGDRLSENAGEESSDPEIPEKGVEYLDDTTSGGNNV